MPSSPIQALRLVLCATSAAYLLCTFSLRATFHPQIFVWNQCGIFRLVASQITQEVSELIANMAPRVSKERLQKLLGSPEYFETKIPLAEGHWSGASTASENWIYELADHRYMVLSYDHDVCSNSFVTTEKETRSYVLYSHNRFESFLIGKTKEELLNKFGTPENRKCGPIIKSVRQLQRGSDIPRVFRELAKHEEEWAYYFENGSDVVLTFQHHKCTSYCFYDTYGGMKCWWLF